MSNYNNLVINEAVTDVVLDDGQLERMADFYEGNRLDLDRPVRTGLYGEDLVAAAKGAGTVMLKYEVQVDEASVDSPSEPVYAPVLVPTGHMEWYNMPFLAGKFGPDTPLYCYVHPPVPEDEASRQLAADAVQKALDEGAVVLFEQYRGDPVLDGSQWVAANQPAEGIEGELVSRGGGHYLIESMGSGRNEKKSDIFIGQVNFDGIETVQEAPSITDAYTNGVASGAIEADRDNGAVIETEMSDEDAQRIWEIYKGPFDRLSRDNAVVAGFEEDHLKHMMQDPNVIKVVNRKDGEITTVGVFMTDFEQCPWFNTEYYKREYPEYFKTGNILMCPSIVTDEERWGGAYSWALVKLLAQVCAQRGSNVLLTFECTEISTKYIPGKVVRRGVKQSGVGDTEGLDAPVATMEYKAVRKLESKA